MKQRKISRVTYRILTTTPTYRSLPKSAWNECQKQRIAATWAILKFQNRNYEIRMAFSPGLSRRAAGFWYQGGFLNRKVHPFYQLGRRAA